MNEKILELRIIEHKIKEFRNKQQYIIDSRTSNISDGNNRLYCCQTLDNQLSFCDKLLQKIQESGFEDRREIAHWISAIKLNSELNACDDDDYVDLAKKHLESMKEWVEGIEQEFNNSMQSGASPK